MADAATVLTGGGMLGARAPGVAGQIARTAGKVGSVIDPTLLPIKAAKAATKIPKVGKWPAQAAGATSRNLAGALTGSGGENFRYAAGSGRAAGKAAGERMYTSAPGEIVDQLGKHRGDAFQRMIRGGDMRATVDKARAAFKALHKKKSEEYRVGMTSVHESKKVIPFSRIDKALRDVSERGVSRGQSGTAPSYTVNPRAEPVWKEVADIVDEFRFRDPKEWHTPTGMDALKRRIGDMYDDPAAAHGTVSRGVVDSVYNAIKGEIIKVAPEYAKVLRNYDDARTALDDIEQALSVGHKARLDTAARKLTSAMRNNVNTSFNVRQKAAEALGEATTGSRTLMDELAGASLASGRARGIQGGIAPLIPGTTLAGKLAESGAEAATFGQAALETLPIAAGTAAVTSPYLMGQAAHYGGRAVGLAEHLAQEAGKVGGRSGKLGAAVRGAAHPMARLAPWQLNQLEEDLRMQGLY
jgi:hypothetical protein